MQSIKFIFWPDLKDFMTTTFIIIKHYFKILQNYATEVSWSNFILKQVRQRKKAAGSKNLGT